MFIKRVPIDQFNGTATEIDPVRQSVVEQQALPAALERPQQVEGGILTAEAADQQLGEMLQQAEERIQQTVILALQERLARLEDHIAVEHQIKRTPFVTRAAVIAMIAINLVALGRFIYLRLYS